MSHAMMPKAGMSIGTKATITYKDASDILHTRESDIVLTTIAQVYQVEVTAMRNPARAERGENADIPFQVKNVGNGIDDVTFSVKKFPNQVDKITFFSADAGGAARPGTGVESSAGNPVPFTLKGLDAGGGQKYFVLRMPIPKSAQNDDLLSTELDVATKGGRSSDVSADALVIGRRPFSVVPIGAAKLNNKKDTWVTFRVNGGLTNKVGYFQMWAVNSKDVSKPLKYKVGARASFNRSILRPEEFDGSDDTLFKIKHEVGANGSYLIQMPIHIDDAHRGDEIVMFAKYGEADQAAIKPLSGNDSLEKSTGFVIRFDHMEVQPELEVFGNSKDGPSRDFTRIDQALSGETVQYDLVLRNKSTFDDTFVIQELTDSKGELIAKVTPMDAAGAAALRIGAQGLPEIGPIPSNGELKFKIAVQLRDGRTSDVEQNVQFRFKALNARTVEPLIQVLTIVKVISGSGPVVKFANTDDMEPAVKKLTIDDGADVKRFYMNISNADSTDKLTHEYQMRFADKGFTIRPYINPGCGAPISNSGPIDSEGKTFCVVADLRGISRLESKVVVSDSARSAQTSASITILKMPVIEFASTAYDSSGTPGGDAALTVRIVNRGGNMASNVYELWHDTMDPAAATNTWPTAFSYDERNWEHSLVLPELKSGGSKDVFVKIAIPQDVSIDRHWSLTLGLREVGGGDNKSKASTIVTLVLDDSGLVVVKEVAVVKSPVPMDCGSSAVPRNFSKATNAKVNDGDCIWYRISVTNLPASATVHSVQIADPIPEHSSYADGAQANMPEASPKIDGGKIVTQGVDLEPDTSLLLTYPVTVNFRK
ncbi:hypothetical protein D9O50_04710 [Oxalobacteraceae bacterium CAVE-383]|nr:hypothetical protein D9O50_04710 [Oxalobacteraceae bacterium CAVE-383]